MHIHILKTSGRIVFSCKETNQAPKPPLQLQTFMHSRHVCVWRADNRQSKQTETACLANNVRQPCVFQHQRTPHREGIEDGVEQAKGQCDVM
jgi:hypothetical protein